MSADAALKQAALAIAKLRAAETGGCFNPVDDTQGECADGDCYCTRQCEREAAVALEAAGFGEAEARGYARAIEEVVQHFEAKAAAADADHDDASASFYRNARDIVRALR